MTEFNCGYKSCDTILDTSRPDECVVLEELNSVVCVPHAEQIEREIAIEMFKVGWSLTNDNPVSDERAAELIDAKASGGPVNIGGMNVRFVDGSQEIKR